MLHRQQLTVIPADDPKKIIGWMVHENIGVAIVNEWPFLPWYKKMLRRRFYTDMWGHLFPKKRRVEYY